MNHLIRHYDVFQFPPPRGGERFIVRVFIKLSVISIPAPARGRTVAARIAAGESASYFNSRPREGANLAENVERVRGADFNSRPREGANAVFSSKSLGLTNFNSRPREGANVTGH